MTRMRLNAARLVDEQAALADIESGRATVGRYTFGSAGVGVAGIPLALTVADGFGAMIVLGFAGAFLGLVVYAAQWQDVVDQRQAVRRAQYLVNLYGD